MSTNFGFLRIEWPQMYESAMKAKASTIGGPAVTCQECHATSVALLELRCW